MFLCPRMEKDIENSHSWVSSAQLLVSCRLPESFGMQEILRERHYTLTVLLNWGTPERRACLSPQEASEVAASTDASYCIYCFLTCQSQWFSLITRLHAKWLTYWGIWEWKEGWCDFWARIQHHRRLSSLENVLSNFHLHLKELDAHKKAVSVWQ